MRDRAVGSGLDLPVGRIQLGWGKTDGYSPADAFLPRDLTDPFADEKLPIWGLRLTGQRGPVRIEAFGSAVTTPWRIAALGTRNMPLNLESSLVGLCEMKAVARRTSPSRGRARDEGGLDVHEIARSLSPWERAALSDIAAERRVEAFYTCWTRKEAYVKALGLGLSMPFEQFSVSLMPGSPGVLLETTHSAGADRWSLHDISVSPGYVAALAVESGGQKLRFFDIDVALLCRRGNETDVGSLGLGGVPFRFTRRVARRRPRILDPADFLSYYAAVSRDLD